MKKSIGYQLPWQIGSDLSLAICVCHWLGAIGCYVRMGNDGKKSSKQCDDCNINSKNRCEVGRYHGQKLLRALS